MFPKINSGWENILAEEIAKPYFQTLEKTIQSHATKTIVYPPAEKIFHTFTLCPLSELKVVILGQDPYHGFGQAHGLSFSVPDNVPIPPSLKNIYKEIQTDLNLPIPTSGNLEPWARQGVLLLNSTLTVMAGKPSSHQGLGWEIFTDTVIEKISTNKNHVVFILWGKYAQAKAGLIDNKKHLILIAPHPSPLSAYTGFFGSKPFSQTNEFLIKNNLKPINW